MRGGELYMNWVTAAGFVVSGLGLVVDYMKDQQDKTEQQAYIDRKIDESINKRLTEKKNTKEDV